MWPTSALQDAAELSLAHVTIWQQRTTKFFPKTQAWGLTIPPASIFGGAS
jgi:hypothetical protein